MGIPILSGVFFGFFFLVFCLFVFFGGRKITPTAHLVLHSLIKTLYPYDFVCVLCRWTRYMHKTKLLLRLVINVLFIKGKIFNQLANCYIALKTTRKCITKVHTYELIFHNDNLGPFLPLHHSKNLFAERLSGRRYGKLMFQWTDGTVCSITCKQTLVLLTFHPGT